MTKPTPDFPIAKEFFTAWGKFRASYTIVYESTDISSYCMYYSYKEPPLNESMVKIIRTSDLSDRLKSVAEDLIFGGDVHKKELILNGVVTPDDLACINSTLLFNICGNTRSEQEKIAITDYLTYGFSDKDNPPCPILFNTLDYATLRTIFSYKKVLNEDEENIITLLMLGEMKAEELCPEECELFVTATNKLHEAFRSTDLEFYKQVVSYYLKIFPERREEDVCNDFSLSPARFHNVLYRYFPHTWHFVLNRELNRKFKS